MKDLSSFSQYHPSWEGRDFTRDEYASLLDDLSKKKADEALLTDGKSIKIANTVTKLWQTIKGWLGLENQVDPVKVNYELLKLLRYGEAHHYLNNTQVRTIVQNLALTLGQDKNKSYEKITKLINEILPITNDVEATQLVDREINVFYKANHDHLKEAFWPNLIHKYIAPISYDAARLHYNQAKIHASEGRQSEAIQDLESALKISPNKPHWQLALARSLLMHAEHQSVPEALDLCKKALKTVKEINEGDEVSLNELAEVKAKAYLSCCALSIKQENYETAFAYLTEFKNEELSNDPVFSYWSFTTDHPFYKASNLQEADFTFHLSEHTPDVALRILQLNSAVKKFHESYTDTNASYINQQLIKANFKLVECHIQANTIDEAKTAFDDAWAILKELRNSRNMIAFNRFSKPFQEQAESLLNVIDPKTDLQGAITVTLHLKDFYQNDPKKCAETCKSLADLYTLSGDDRLALKELEQAYSLAPSQDLNESIQELARLLASSALSLNKHAEAVTYLKKIQTLSPTDKYALKQLATVHIQLANWKDAETWADRWMTAYPQDHEAFLLASSIATRLNRPDFAIKYARVAIKLAPNEPKVIIQLFDLTGEIDAHNISESIKIAKGIVQENPNDWRIHMQLGGLYQAIKDYDQAQDHLRAAKRLNIENADVCASLGRVYLEKKEHAHALKEFEQAAALKKSAAPFIEPLMDCYSVLADQAFSNAHYPEMFSHYGHMLQLAPAKTEIIQKLLVAGKQLEQKHPAQAAEAYKIALNSAQPNTLDKEQLVQIYQHLASEEIKVRAFGNAIALLEKARGLDSKNLNILKPLADCYTITEQTLLAEQTWKVLESLGYKPDESQPALANLYLKQGNFTAALPLFQQLNETSVGKSRYQGQLHDCFIGLALRNESPQPIQAIDQYEQSLSLASNDQKQATAARLLGFGNALLKSGQHTLALKCFSLGIESAPVVGNLPPQLAGEAYVYLARSNIQQKKYEEASKLYQKALITLPNHIDLILETAEFDFSQGDFEHASFNYRKAMNLQPAVPSHRQKLVTTELTAANKNYGRGVHDPERVRLATLDLVSKATSAQFPHAKKIENALKSWLGKNFGDSHELATLAIKAKSPHQIERDGRKACELIEKAYDGGWFHMKPEEMPQELAQAIQVLREEIAGMRAYYVTLQQRTEQLAVNLQSTPLADQFSNVPFLSKLQDLKDASRVEEQTKNFLQLIAKAKQKNPLAITPALEQEIKTLQQLSLPSGWMHLAIEHYRNVLELNPHEYGDHCNKLIDAYVKVGDNINAIATYERLRVAFPTAPLRIDNTAYTKIIEAPTPQTQISNQQMVDGLIRAGDQKNQERNYAEAITIYNQAIKIATPKQTGEIAKRLLNLGDTLLNSASRQEAIKAYESIVPYLNVLNLSNDQLVSIFGLLGNEAKLAKDYEEALSYYNQALSINPSHAKIHAEVGDLYIIQNDPEKALASYQKALEIEPSNLSHLQHLADLEIAIGDRYYAQGLLNSQSIALKNFVQYVTNEAPYAGEIKSSLGYRLGSLSSDNRALNNLGSATTAEEIAAESEKAIELIRKAYDGKDNHKKPEEMPEDLKSKLELLETQLTAFQFSMKMLSKEYQEATVSTNNLINPLLQAIAYYEKANVRFPQTYGAHYNRLIDSFVQQEEPLKAFNLFNKLKKTFPGSPLQINPIAYRSACDAFVKQKDYEMAFKIIESGITEFPNNLMLKKSKSDLYFVLGKIEQQGNRLNTAAMLYTLATKCGVDADSACYINLAKIYLLAKSGKTKISFNIRPPSWKTTTPPDYSEKPELDHLSFIGLVTLEEYPSHFQAAVAHLKKAADLDPKNAELRFQLGRIVYGEPENLSFDIVPYLQEALRLEPKNVSYAYGLMMTMMGKYNLSSADPQVNEVLEIFKGLGGEIIGDDEAYWTLKNPYEFAIEE